MRSDFHISSNSVHNITFHITDKQLHLVENMITIVLATDAMKHHTELPVVSENKINFYEAKIIRGSNLPILTQAHGTLSLILL